jgi:hypothetical protein
MPENTNNVIKFPDLKQNPNLLLADTSVNRKHFWDRLTRRGKVAAGAGALLAVSTIVAATGPEAPVNPDKTIVDVKDNNQSTSEINAEQELITYTVKPGDSVSEVVSKVYGADDGENIMNNEFYAEEVAAVESNITEGQLLQPDQVLELPADITEHSPSVE